MKHYPNAINAMFGAVLLVTAMFCVAIIVATIFYIYISVQLFQDQIGRSFWFTHCSICIPYVLVIASSFFVRKNLLTGMVPYWTYFALLISTGLALFISFGWFSHHMHDLSVFFHWHGRWGCDTLNADGSPYYTIDASNAPYIAFGPALLALGLHFIWSQSKRLIKGKP